MVANAIAVLGDVASSILSSSLSKKGAEDSSALQYEYQSRLNRQNYKYNKDLINMQNAFNESMMDKANAYNDLSWERSAAQANTAHQREVADLRAAGLNPILSANNGASVVSPLSSAQTSSGNSQLSSSAGMPDIDYVGAISTANQMRNENKRVDNELSNSKTQRQYVEAETYNTYNQAQINSANSASEISLNKAKEAQIVNDIKNNNLITNARLGEIQSNITHNQSSARHFNQQISESKQRIQNLSTQNKYYAVDRGIKLGKFGTFGVITYPNQPKTKSPNGSFDNTHPKGVHYEIINGHRVPVRSF